ncbi:MAG: DUF4386 domain-containing protein [Gemmatimonadota bacterium]|nr:DUF4386 domain-containing protein [Gemmatimonadota bacterium]
MGRSAAASAEAKARIAGGLWLAVIATGGFAAFVSTTLIVRDPAATIANILRSEGLFRLGFASNLVASVCYIGVTVILYELLKVVSRTLSLFAAFLGLAGSAAGAAGSLAFLFPLIVLEKAVYLSGFTADQLQGLAFAFLRLNAQGFNVSMAFFGFQIITVGYLILRSTFLPRILGALLVLGGASYVIASFLNFVAPPSGARLSTFIIPVAVLGEGSLTLWLLVKGVNLRNWEEQRLRGETT